MAAAVGSVGNTPDISQTVFKGIDANSDGQISADEFGGFLTRFMSELNKLSAASGGTTAISSAVATAASVSTLPSTPTAAAGLTITGPFAPIQGFDFGKLQNTGYSSEKYSPAVRVFSQGLAAGVPVVRNNLQAMADYAKANGFSGATVAGDDKIDFGDGKGPIDVVQVNESIWFQNT